MAAFPQSPTQYAAERLIEHISKLDQTMAGETVRLMELLAHSTKEDHDYIQKRYEELIQERQQRMFEVMASKAAKDVTARRMYDASWTIPRELAHLLEKGGNLEDLVEFTVLDDKPPK